MRDDLVAGFEQRERGVEQCLLAAGAEDDLGFLVIDSVIQAVALADRAAELGDAGHRRVLAEVPVNGVSGRGLGGLEGREVGLPRAEVDDLDAFTPQPIDRRADFHRRRGGNARRAAGQPHRLTPMTFSRRRSSINSGTRPWTLPPSEKTSLISRELM